MAQFSKIIELIICISHLKMDRYYPEIVPIYLSQFVNWHKTTMFCSHHLSIIIGSCQRNHYHCLSTQIDPRTINMVISKQQLLPSRNNCFSFPTHHKIHSNQWNSNKVRLICCPTPSKQVNHMGLLYKICLMTTKLQLQWHCICNNILMKPLPPTGVSPVVHGYKITTLMTS